MSIELTGRIIQAGSSPEGECVTITVEIDWTRLRDCPTNVMYKSVKVIIEEKP